MLPQLMLGVYTLEEAPTPLSTTAITPAAYLGVIVLAQQMMMPQQAPVLMATP